MFKLEKIKVQELNAVNQSDKIPYMLSGASLLHKQGITGKGIKVAVVDTGCDWNHEALVDNIKDSEKDHNMCGYAGGGMDDHMHGCINGNAKILTSKDGIVSIKDFYEKTHGTVIQDDKIATVKDISDLNIFTTSLKGNDIVKNKIQNIHAVNVEEELIVVEYKKSKIKLTPWHKVYVQTSSRGLDRTITKKRADELEVGDRLIINFNSIYERETKHEKINGIKIDDNFMWLLGVIMTDGHINKSIKSNRIEISQSDENKEVIEKCMLYLETLKEKDLISKYSYDTFNRNEEYQSTHRVIIYGSEFINTVLSFGLERGKRNNEVRVPKYVYTLDKKLIGAYLAGLIDGDGCISTNGRCRVVSNSKNFTEDLYEIFNMIGVVSSCGYNGNGNGKSTFGDCEMYSFSFSMYEEYDFIYENISISRKKNIKKGSSSHKTVAIKSIEKENFDGILYDLTIEENHNYIANGVIVSNTHVASTIVELAPNVEIIPYKCLAPYGGENAWVIKALNQIADRDDIDVVNMSLSSTMKIGSDDQVALHEVIKRLNEKNVFMAVASGNTGTEKTLFPACFEEVTTVGAVDINRHEASFSTLSNHVDVCQVGVDLLGALLGGGYVKISGTSMATPMIAGMVALLIEKYKSQHDGRRPLGSFINNMLKLFAIDLGVKGLDTKTGAGFISFNPNASVTKMVIDSKDYTVNGEVRHMDVAPYLKTPENRTLSPIRYANHDKVVMFDQPTKTITMV